MINIWSVTNILWMISNLVTQNSPQKKNEANLFLIIKFKKKNPI